MTYFFLFLFLILLIGEEKKTAVPLKLSFYLVVSSVWHVVCSWVAAQCLQVRDIDLFQ
jgi:hypothetical protein